MPPAAKLGTMLPRRCRLRKHVLPLPLRTAIRANVAPFRRRSYQGARDVWLSGGYGGRFGTPAPPACAGGYFQMPADGLRGRRHISGREIRCHASGCGEPVSARCCRLPAQKDQEVEPQRERRAGFLLLARLRAFESRPGRRESARKPWGSGLRKCRRRARCPSRLDRTDGGIAGRSSLPLSSATHRPSTAYSACNGPSGHSCTPHGLVEVERARVGLVWRHAFVCKSMSR